jgi:hypothetical protein
MVHTQHTLSLSPALSRSLTLSHVHFSSLTHALPSLTLSHPRTKVFGCDVNIPPGGNKTCQGWSLEIAFPLAAISLNNTNALPIKHGSYWRINFSRVEWKAHIEGGAASGGLASGGDASSRYVLGEKAGDGSCDWPCPGGCKQNPGDNWLWAPLGIGKWVWALVSGCGQW